MPFWAWWGLEKARAVESPQPWWGLEKAQAVESPQPLWGLSTQPAAVLRQTQAWWVLPPPLSWPLASRRPRLLHIHIASVDCAMRGTSSAPAA